MARSSQAPHAGGRARREHGHDPGGPMRILDDFDELTGLSGQELGSSEWLEVDQGRVNAFADATGDHQWIHVDVERAASGPFGGTVAHGYLTLSLIPFL